MIGAAVALTVTEAAEVAAGTTWGQAYVAVKPNQVDNRTQRSDWGMTVHHEVVTEDGVNYLEVTTEI